MNETNEKNNLDKITSLSNEELNNIFSQLSASEIEDLITKINEVGTDE